MSYFPTFLNKLYCYNLFPNCLADKKASTTFTDDHTYLDLNCNVLYKQEITIYILNYLKV